MKYVIKSPRLVSNDYIVRDSANTFSYSPSLEHATKFDSMEDAVAVIVTRTVKMGIGKFTIVGASEIPSPKFEEVIL